MTDYETLKKQLIRDEGIVLYAYQDSLGYWTIGVGHLIDRRKGGKISLEIALDILEEDIVEHTRAVVGHLAWADPHKIGPVRFGALINMHFQLGDGLFRFTKTLAYMEAGEWEAASLEMLVSKWAQQTPERAQRISDQVRLNEWR